MLKRGDATYKGARQWFRKICKGHHVYGKWYLTRNILDLAKNELVNKNANIQRVLFAEGAEKEALYRTVIRYVFCRHAADNVIRLKEIAQEQAAAGTEIKVK